MAQLSPDMHPQIVNACPQLLEYDSNEVDVGVDMDV